MKMKEFIDKIKNNKKFYYTTIMVLVLLLSVTFAYVIDQISGGAISKIFITADTADNLQFEVDKDILIKPTQFNFEKGGLDLSDTAVATARLRANSTNNTAKYSYNVYFLIEENGYNYTTDSRKTEMLLEVTDPTGNKLVELPYLKYDDSLSGFDITNQDGLLIISENYEISSNSSLNFTEQNWTIKVSFINLETNQIDNEGKTLNGKILIQQVKFGDVHIDVNNLKSVYGYNGILSCNGEGSSYNSKYGLIEVSKINKRSTICTVNYELPTNTEYLNNKLIQLTTNEPVQGNGKLVHETFTTAEGSLVDTGYRYEGKNPNNYIWFNNELWRIIGVFDDKTHGVENSNLVKIIRNESIGALKWSGSSNNWVTGTLNKLLNDAYYNRQDGTNSRNCYSYSIISTSCDYRVNGIRDNYREMIKEVTWHLGGVDTYTKTAAEFYTAERGTATGASNGYPSETKGHIGIFYPSDFMYGAPSDSCSRDIKNGYGLTKEGCLESNWLFGKSVATITPVSSGSSKVIILTNRYMSTYDYSFQSSILPVLYLDSNVYVIGGTGSSIDPYIIGM